MYKILQYCLGMKTLTCLILTFVSTSISDAGTAWYQGYRYLRYDTDISDWEYCTQISNSILASNACTLHELPAIFIYKMIQ